MSTDPFLKVVAAELYQQFGRQLYKIAVVFPNHRQGIFFKYYLQQIIDPPAILPDFFTIETFIERSSSHIIADHTTQLFELYKAYKKVAGQQQGNNILDYEKFYFIGDMILRDFDELDSYLSEITQVYKQLENIESLVKSFHFMTEQQKQFLASFWSSFSFERKSAQQQLFLAMWEMLPAIYQLFHRQLSDAGYTTRGMAYRQLATDTSVADSFSDNWIHIAFIGFNAFNKAEEKILKTWQQQEKSSLWLDADKHYVDNPQHEAGYFIRRNIHTLALKNAFPLYNKISDATTPIEVIATQGSVTQAKMIASWLQPALENHFSAAIILADENLLLPVLQSLPEEVENVNITMGYSLQQSILFSFIQLFFSIQKNLSVNHNCNVDHTFVVGFLQHPLCDWDSNVRQSIQHNIIKNKLMYYPLNQLQNHTDIGNYIFVPLHQPKDIFDRLLQLLKALHQNKIPRIDILLQGLLAQTWQSVQQLQEQYNAFTTAELNLSFLCKILRKQLSMLRIPFEGTPLKGIQIMGLLESRGLDFDRIILLGANEGTLPKIQSNTSFLPYNIRRAYGLSLPEHQDAIYAYTFYRLLHHCKQITIVYNSIISDTSTGEVSRFIPQLEFETKCVVNKKTTGFSLKSNTARPITIPKTKEVMEKCNPYFLSDNPKTISPSAINTYIDCPLQFYFRYIANLKEPDELQEDIDAKTFGNIVHALMELLYEALRKKNGHWKVQKEDIEWLKEQIPLLLDQAFIKGWMGNSTKSLTRNGKLSVIAEVVKQYSYAYLAHDATLVPFEVEALETKFKEIFYITINGKKRPIYLSGYIDRIDIANGVYRMVDYKTGSDTPEFSAIEQLFDPLKKNRNKAALQTLLYAWMFSKKFPEKKRFSPVLLPIRDMQKHEKPFTGYLKEKTTGSDIYVDNILAVLEQLESRLKAILEELFDTRIPFKQTENREKCTFCPYANICERE